MPQRASNAFLSYAHLDDTDQYVEKLCLRLAKEISKCLGRKFEIFSDRDLLWGQCWRGKIEESVAEAVCFIPIITPAFFSSVECRKELEQFREHELRANRNDLIFPICLINVDDLSERSLDPLKRLIASRQYRDWTKLRHDSLGNKKVKTAIADLAQSVHRVITLGQLSSSDDHIVPITRPTHTKIDSLLSRIAAHSTEPVSKEQVGELMLLAREEIDTSPRTVARLFKVLDKHVKRLGDRRLVLSVAELALDAAKRSERDEDIAKWEAHALICGVSWVNQRVGKLAEARASAERSLTLGEHIGYDENTAFCRKCLGRLARMQAERERDSSKKVASFQESIDLLTEAIQRFTAMNNYGPNSPEVGDCYSLLARTFLSMGKLQEAVVAASKAEKLLPQNSKDYLDLLILNGDISAATRNHKDALGWYNEATRYGVAEGAEISEMRARAYFQRAKLQADGIGRTAHAKSDFEQAASIWGALGETKAASEAEWELAILNNELSREVVQLLGKEVPRVRIIALEQFRKERAAHSARGIAKRQQAGSEYWEWKVKEARRLFALEESDW